jgi:hypothetical protein
LTIFIKVNEFLVSGGRGEIKSKAIPLYAMMALGGRGDIAPTH